MLIKQPLSRPIKLEPRKWLSTNFIPLRASKNANGVTDIVEIEVVVMSFDFTNLSYAQIAKVINKAYFKLDS